MSIRKKGIIALILAMIGGIILYKVVLSDGFANKGTEVEFLTPQISSGANMGAELPYVLAESEHQLIFYCSIGIFKYDLDHQKILRAFIPGGPEFYREAEFDKPTNVRINEDHQTIEIYKGNQQKFNYYYVYDINKDKLYKCPIEELEKMQEQPVVSTGMNTSDWTIWNLSYTSNLTGKTYYPFRSIAK